MQQFGLHSIPICSMPQPLLITPLLAMATTTQQAHQQEIIPPVVPVVPVVPNSLQCMNCQKIFASPNGLAYHTLHQVCMKRQAASAAGSKSPARRTTVPSPAAASRPRRDTPSADKTLSPSPGITARPKREAAAAAETTKHTEKEQLPSQAPSGTPSRDASEADADKQLSPSPTAITRPKWDHADAGLVGLCNACSVCGASVCANRLSTHATTARAALYIVAMLPRAPVLALRVT